MSKRELRAKYRELAEPVLGTARARRIEAIVTHLDAEPSPVPELLDLLLASIPSR
jgi:hypothetical protein